MESFVWEHIISRFEILKKIITDHGTQFDNQKFKDYCAQFKIVKAFSSPIRPQANGQVEAVNKTLKRTLKSRLGKHKGAWVDELPGVLWSY